MRLLQIRHGQTPHNVTGTLDTAVPGAGLTALGRNQARAVPAALAEETVHAVYATTLRRTQLTAAPLAEARGLTVRVRPGLEEVPAGDLEMRRDAPAVAAYAGTLVAWLEGDLGHRTPGGPDGHEFLAGYDAAIRAVAAQHGPEETVAVFGHGAAMRVWTAVRTGLDARAGTALRIMNTGLGAVEGDPDAGWRLLRWQAEPLGGLDLADVDAHDATGRDARRTAREG